MKAARLYGKHDIRIGDMDEPAAGPGELVMKIGASSVCGTDVRFFQNGKPGVDEQHPLVLGHELAGTIVEVGTGVSGYQTGLPVAVAPNYGCGVCDLCVSGETHLCRESEALGVTIDGGFAEYVRIPAAAVRQGNVAPVPPGLSLSEASLAEPLSCVYSAYEKIGIYPGDGVLVIGSGPIGIMHAKVALMAGAARVLIHDVNEARLDQAVAIEPRLVPIRPGKVEEGVVEATSGKLCDLVITAAGVPAVQQMAFGLAGINGRIMFFGGLPKGRSMVELDTNEIHYKLLTVSGTTRQSLRQYRKCLDLMASGVLDIGPVVTAERPVEELEAVIRSVGSDENLKTAIVFS